jgi:TonB-dependent starch-binding outer membrane protein SusC
MKKKKLHFLLLTCFIALFSFPLRAQEPSKHKFAEVAVTGTVVDENGKTLPGITVQVKGGKVSTITDPEGNYRIVVARPDAVLLFSFVGYQTKEVDFNNHAVINASMQLSTKTLSDVVVIGYGTQAKKDLTGAVSSFDARKLEERPIERIDQALVGQLPGVTVKQTTGIPGKAFSIQIRGSGSISAGNEPLYVIDGFPLTNNSTNTGNGSYTGGNPLDNINPNDIESIDVLKDAAAAAIYGSRASNGVVIITTKRGQIGKTRIAINTYTGYNQASKKLKMLDDKGWIDRATEMINAAYVLKYPGALASDDSITRIGRVGAFNTAYFLDSRWAVPGHPGLEYFNGQDAVERTGMMTSQEISASGGTDAVRYFISGNYSNQDGFIKGVGFKEYSARANLTINAAKGLRLGINVAPTYSITEDPGVEGKDNIFHQALSTSVVQFDSVGLYPNIGKNAQYPWSNSNNSAVGKLLYNIGETKRFRTLGTIYGEWEIIKGLNLRSSVNLDNTDNNATTYVPYITTGTQTSRTFNAQTNPNLTSATSGTYNSFRRQTFVNENTLTYAKVFHEVHSLHVLIGQAFNTDRLDQVSLSSNGGFTSSVIQTLGAAAGVTGNTNSSKNTFVSYFSRVQYAYKDRYLLSASLREDGSSRFGINNQYAKFPSVSLGWRIIDEDFMKSLTVLSDLKIRASYGVNGNYFIGNYSSIPTLGSYGYSLGTTQGAVIGQAPNVLANPDLQWEKSQTYDGGVDFGFLNNRIVGSFDYYNKLNTRLLLNVQVPEVTGFQSFLNNIGSVRNIGEELQVTTRNFISKFQWSTTFNISHNTNKIESLAPGQTQIIIPNGLDVSDQILRVGQPLNSIFVVKQIGILTQADLNNHVALYGTGETVGDPKYQDLNGDGVITAPGDEQIVGHPNPDYTWGITNSFHYKGFDLSVLIQGQHGGSIYSDLGRALNRTGQGFSDNAPAFYADRWRSPSSPGKGNISKAYSTFGFVANTNWLYSSDYVRVRNITLGYDLKNIIKTSAIQNARLYLSAENFFGTDKYYGGLNPEAANTTISSNASYPEAGDYGGLPLAKSLIIGLNITF